MAEDPLGDLLRDFYGAFGVAGEGPPKDANVSALMGESAPPDDLALLRDALLNHALRRHFIECRQLLDDVATRLNQGELLRELAALSPLPPKRFDELSSGVFWFSLASSLDKREGGKPTTPFDEHLDLPLPVKVKLAVEGSLVLQLYMALVYMREGVLSELIAEGARAKSPCCGRVNKLLHCDFLRRIRNALAHGTFSSCIAGIAFRDNGVVVATPGFLSDLCTWLMLLQLQALAAKSQETSAG